jgi:hypothetical protein
MLSSLSQILSILRSHKYQAYQVLQIKYICINYSTCSCYYYTQNKLYTTTTRGPSVPHAPPPLMRTPPLVPTHPLVSSHSRPHPPSHTNPPSRTLPLPLLHPRLPPVWRSSGAWWGVAVMQWEGWGTWGCQWWGGACSGTAGLTGVQHGTAWC